MFVEWSVNLNNILVFNQTCMENNGLKGLRSPGSSDFVSIGFLIKFSYSHFLMADTAVRNQICYGSISTLIYQSTSVPNLMLL